MEYNATTTRIFDIPPYTFFAIVGVVFSSTLFILLLLKYNFHIQRYTKIFFFSGIGLLLGAKLFGFLTGLYRALANSEPITLDTFMKTGVVFYGGLIGFLASFFFICKIWNKKIEHRVVDIAVVCIPLFHFWGRLGCFFGGCCYGEENHSFISVIYTNKVIDEIMTVSRIPIQLIEACLNIVIFIILYNMMLKNKFEEHLILVYLSIYAILRIFIEMFRGDLNRGVWNGISFGQVVSVLILMYCIIKIIKLKYREG